MHGDRDSTHRVLMNFMVRPGGWHISFLEKDCRTVLPLKRKRPAKYTVDGGWDERIGYLSLLAA
jgi:hypothetical protein